MVDIRMMQEAQVDHIKEIDRSEHIDVIFEIKDGEMIEVAADHECPNWDDSLLKEIQERFLYELQHGGMAIGAYDGSLLVGFAVLAHRFRGIHRDTLQVDLIYVSRNYRRQGIGSMLMKELCNEARRRGAKALYISSTETSSAVSFYRSQGSQMANVVDEELFKKEPKDIHMVIEL